MNTEPIQIDVERQLALAMVWKKRQRHEQAITGFKNTLKLDPKVAQAYIGLGNILYEQGRMTEALELYRKGLAECPTNEAVLHKGYLNVLEELSGLEACFKAYELTRKDQKNLDLKGDEKICLSVVRNEKLRLPYFLSFYRALGIEVFFFVDNQSNDGTLEYLLQQKDVFLWQSDFSFNKSNSGSAWFEILLRSYGKGHWCLTVDADELLHFPGSEKKCLHQLCEQLEEDGKRAFKAILLDMYSDKPVNQTLHSAERNFLDVCPYFDKRFYHSKFEKGGPFKNQTSYFGGMRERVFGQVGQYFLNKVPLLKYDTDMVLAGGQHWTNLPSRHISSESGALLHFKFFSTFVPYVEQEIQRGEHYDNAMQYKQYYTRVKEDKTLRLYDKQHSIKFVDSWQLVKLGIMTSRYDGETRLLERNRNGFPSISPVVSPDRRPIWSVMITVHKRVDYIENALRSVLRQVKDFQDFQIEVILDGVPTSLHDQIVEKVSRIGKGKVGIHRTAANVGQPQVFNVCLERSKGHWIHILHDDDWVQNGFYQTLRDGIEHRSDIGAAFCRHAFVDEKGETRRISWVEREHPGILDNWLERIWVMCRIQTPSIVVKRAVYEQLGGYSDRVGSAWDWDMWKRISVHFPVWYEPQQLAFFREHHHAESTNLLLSGKQIQDSRKCIERAKEYLPAPLGRILTERARNHYALYALGLAKTNLKEKHFEAAFANLREGLKCSQSPRVKQELIHLLQSNGKADAS